MLGISIPAFIFADHWNRRTCVIFGGSLLTGCMYIIGSLYAAHAVHANGGSGRWVVIFLLFVFAMGYVSTWGIVGKIYATEIQPQRTRAAANSAAQGMNFVSSFISLYYGLNITLLTSSSLIEHFFLAYELACCICYPDLPRSIIVWPLLSLRLSFSLYHDDPRDLYA